MTTDTDKLRELREAVAFHKNLRGADDKIHGFMTMNGYRAVRASVLEEILDRIDALEAENAALRKQPEPSGDTDKLREALAALLDYEQADMDGVVVRASREAIHVVHDACLSFLEAKQPEPSGDTDKLFFDYHEKWRFGTDDDAETAQEWVMENLPTLLEENAALRARLKELEGALEACADEMASFGYGCGMRCQLETTEPYFEEEIGRARAALKGEG